MGTKIINLSSGCIRSGTISSFSNSWTSSFRDLYGFLNFNDNEVGKAPRRDAPPVLKIFIYNTRLRISTDCCFFPWVLFYFILFFWYIWFLSNPFYLQTYWIKKFFLEFFWVSVKIKFTDHRIQVIKYVMLLEQRFLSKISLTFSMKIFDKKFW